MKTSSLMLLLLLMLSTTTILFFGLPSREMSITRKNDSISISTNHSTSFLRHSELTRIATEKTVKITSTEHVQQIKTKPNAQRDGTLFIMMNELKKETIIMNEKEKTTGLVSSAINWKINDTKQFLAYNFTDQNNHYYVNATLRAAAERALIWVDDQEWLTNVTQEDADYLAAKFTEYYPIITQFFGEPADVDGDGIINVSILLTDLKGYAAGYFWNYGQNVNGLTMFYLDSEAGVEGLYDDTLIHEYQHVIHANQDPDGEDAWINEGASDFAVFISGLIEERNNITWKVPYFEDNPGTSLTYWDYDSVDHDVRVDYAKSFLFMVYLAEHYGGDQIISSLVKNPNNGTDGVQAVLSTQGGPPFSQVFNNWVIALYLDRLDVAGGKFGFRSLDLNMSYFGTIDANVSISSSIDEYGFEAYLLENFNGGNWNISFNGDDTTSFNVSIVPLDGDAARFISFVPLDANNDGTITYPAHARAALIISRDEGSSGKYGVSPEKPFTLNITYLPTTELSIANDTIVSVQNHLLNITNVKAFNGSFPITTADLAQVALFDVTGHATGITGNLIVDQATTFNGWKLSNALSLSQLPIGNYSIVITFLVNKTAVTKTLPLEILSEDPSYWSLLVSDELNTTISGNLDLLNVTWNADYLGKIITFRLGLRSIVNFTSGGHRYYVYFDVDNDSYSDYTIFQSSHTGRRHSYFYDFNTGDYFPIETKLLGNSVLFEMSLQFFVKFSTVEAWGKTKLNDGTSVDGSPAAELDLFGAPTFIQVPPPLQEFYIEQVTSISLQWTIADNDPSNYEILVNGSLVASGTWLAYAPITFQLNPTTIGTYNVSLIVNDTTGNQVMNVTLIKLLQLPDSVAPAITGSNGSITIVEGDPDANLQWMIEDDNPNSYILYVNGSVVLNATWNTSPFIITYPLNSLTAGTYFFNITVTDIHENVASLTVLVHVLTPTPPSSSTTTTTPTTTPQSSTSTTTGAEPISPISNDTSSKLPTPSSAITPSFAFLTSFLVLNLILVSSRLASRKRR